MNYSPIRPSAQAAFSLAVAGTILGLLGIDLVLPAIPGLPSTLEGSSTEAQLVLASYTAGTCVGLVIYGQLGDRYSTSRLISFSLLSTAAVSLVCAMVSDLTTLIGLRTCQGMLSAAPATFAPAIIKALFEERHAVRAMGALGSIESLTPALAPVLGAWLLTFGDWRLSFLILAAAGVIVSLMSVVRPLPQTARRPGGSFLKLLGDSTFLRYALSQAFVLGGLLTFTFGMPAVFIHTLGGSIQDFIVMQISGIVVFVITANLVPRFTSEAQTETVITFGTWQAMAGSAAMVIYGLMGGRDPLVITTIFVVLNAGLGIRGPVGFFRAIVAAGGDDARGSALVVVAILAVTALGTSVFAALIDGGPVSLAVVTLGMEVCAVSLLSALPGIGANRHE